MDVLKELTLFMALGEAGSFTEASRQLGIPRATISRRLSRYEDSLGVRLFERSTRALRLTEAGRLLQSRGAALITEAKGLGEDVRQVDDIPRGPLVIAAQTGLGRQFAVGFIHRLHRRCPLVELRLMSSPNPLLEAISAADVILTEGPLRDIDWVSKALGPSDRIAVAAPSYIEEHGCPASLEALSRHSLLSISEAPRQSLRWPLRDGGEWPISPTLTSDDLDTLAQCATEGLGIALLPLTVVALPMAKGELQAVLPERLGRNARFYVLYQQHRRGSPKIRRFLEELDGFIRDSAEALGQSVGATAWGKRGVS